MVVPSYKNHLNRRRGISTIIGGVIFIVLLSAGFSSFFVAMDVQSDAINAQKTVSDLLIDKAKEEFSIAASVDTADANRLGIQVKNLGSNPVQVEDVWVITKSGDFPATKYLVNYQDSLIPTGYGSNILENTPLFMAVDDYEIKVVSTLGTIKKTDLTVGGSNNLRAELIAIPPDVKVGQNVTMTMHVENIGYSTLLNVIPFNDVTLDNYPYINTVFDPANDPPPAKPVDLDPGESTFFTWEYVTTPGTPGAEIIFEVYATSTEEDTGFKMDSDLAREKMKLQEPDESEIIVLTEDLLSRPEIFMVIPGPFGIDNQEGLWGVNVVNPTPIPFDVSKVTISAIVPRSQSQDRIFDTNKCSPNTIAPTPANWACPSDNQLMWESSLTVPPYSVFPFLVKMDPGSLGGSTDDLEAVLVQATVYTTLGQFGKSGYGSSVKNDNSYANVGVYLTDNPRSTASVDIQSTYIGIGSGDTITLAASLADFDVSSSNYIDAGSRLIINVPKGWTVNAPSIDTNGDFNCLAPCPQLYIDTSSQIIGELVANLDGVGNIARSIEFDVTAPIVTNEQMYVMYILAEGTTNGVGGEYAIGPLAEVILQVVP